MGVCRNRGFGLLYFFLGFFRLLLADRLDKGALTCLAVVVVVVVVVGGLGKSALVGDDELPH